MRTRWALALTASIVGLLLLSACASTTTPSSSTLVAVTTTVPEPTTTTVPEIIPGVVSVRYDNAQLAFSLFRPETTSVETQGFGAFLPLTQTPVVAVILPKDLFAGTNLFEAGVYIGASSAPGIAAEWNLPAADSGEVPAGAQDINGLSFAVFTSEGAAAGNIYEERVYRFLSDDTCFEIVELLHSGNLGNFPPNIVEFDREKFQGYLEAIVRTFSFAAQR